MAVSRDGLEQLYGSACSAGWLALFQFCPPTQSAAADISHQHPPPSSGRSTLLQQLLVHVARIIIMPVTHATYMLVAEAQVCNSPRP
jgi:hypothetical protein